MHEKKLQQKNPDSGLMDRIIDRIAAEGDLSFADYMDMAVSHYYAAREPFGVEGDFTTAPEISQMFGEMIGAWFTDLWLQSGQPEKVQLIELGPGRGTLMEDILRTISTWPAFRDAVSVHLVETSPLLRQKQAETLKTCRPTWYDSFEEIPLGVSFIVANEFFDALPVYQFEKKEGHWQERRVGYNKEKQALEFTYAPADFDVAGLMPEDFLDAEEESVFEISPASLSVLEMISARIDECGGAALFIDYGHAKAGLGDTVQAVESHTYASVLENPGGRDVTAHVDFGTLRTVASQTVQVHGPVTQGSFLSRMGIMPRAEALMETANDAQHKDIERALFRLVSPSEMGKLFKVMALMPRDSTITPAGFVEKEDDNAQ